MANQEGGNLAKYGETYRGTPTTGNADRQKPLLSPALMAFEAPGAECGVDAECLAGDAIYGRIHANDEQIDDITCCDMLEWIGDPIWTKN
jgi:hypothetical protein